MKTELTLTIATQAIPVRLSGRLTLEQAFQRIVMNCLAQIEANSRGVLAQDIECLHQMRVGFRRLRAALKLFDKLAPLPADIQQELDWLSQLLGTARDWDVFISSTLENIGTQDWSRQRDMLRHHAHGYAVHAHRAVGSALRSRRYTRLMQELSEWIIGRQWRAQENGLPAMFARDAQGGIPPLLRKAQRRLRQRIRQIDRNDAESRHQVRIAAKKYRYTAEFFLSLLPAKPIKKLLRRLTDLQELLGTLNDIAIADKLLEKLDHDSTHQPVAYAKGYLAAVATEKIGKLKQPLERASSQHQW